MALELHDRLESEHGVGAARRPTTKPRTADISRRSSGPVAHLLVAIGLQPAERDPVTFALQMASAQNARVTLFHVLPPTDQTSVHWLDAIDHLHNNAQRRAHHTVGAIEHGRAEIAAFLKREIPAAVLESLDVHWECRIGDVATEIARFAEERSVDLVYLCDHPPRWRPRLFSSLTQRIAQLNSKPIVFGRSQAKRNGHRTSV